MTYCVDSAIYTCRQRVQTACRQRADSVQTARADSAADGVNAKWVIAYILHDSAQRSSAPPRSLACAADRALVAFTTEFLVASSELPITDLRRPDGVGDAFTLLSSAYLPK